MFRKFMLKATLSARVHCSEDAERRAVGLQ